jgi:hypothetical protein
MARQAAPGNIEYVLLGVLSFHPGSIVAHVTIYRCVWNVVTTGAAAICIAVIDGESVVGKLNRLPITRTVTLGTLPLPVVGRPIIAMAGLAVGQPLM